MNVKFNFLCPVSTRSSSFAVNADISSATQGYAKAAANAATIIDAALATDTASGAIASFSDGAEGLAVKSLVLNVEPSQSGSGDPSPSNIRPISGHTGVTVTRCGKNLAKLLGLGIYNTTTGIAAPSSSSTYAYSDKVACAPSTTYSISAGYTITQALVYYWGADGAFISASTMGGSGNKTFTSIANADMMAIAVRRDQSTSSLSDFPNVQLELGSTATAYEPYTAETYPITFPTAAGTVYGGTVDVTMGEGQKDMDYIDLSELSWNFLSDGDYTTARSRVTAYTSGEGWDEDWTRIKCNCFSTVDPGTSYASKPLYCIFNLKQNYYNFNVKLLTTDYADAAAFKAWLRDIDGNGTHAMFAIPSKTDTPFSVSPAVIKTLKGSNNIWQDSGTIAEVEYYCDTKLYVQKMIAAALNS